MKIPNKIYSIIFITIIVISYTPLSNTTLPSKYFTVNITIRASFPANSFQSWLINPITPFQNISSEYFSQLVNINQFLLNINGITFNNYTLTNDADNNTLINVNKIPEKISSETYMIFNVSYSIFITNKKIPELDIAKAGSLKDIPKKLIDNSYLGFNDAWLNDTDIRTLALSMLNRSNVLDTVLKYSLWIDENILYPVNPPHLEPWNSALVFKYKEGDCDDRAILLISMLRSVGIPAYLQIGSIYMNNNSTEKFNNLYYELINIGWHGWAMVYIPPWGFLPVDLTYFKDAITNYIKINNATYLKITTKDPLNHIIGAALFANTVFVAGSIITSNYVKPSSEWFKTILNSNIEWKERDEGYQILNEQKSTSYITNEKLSNTQQVIFLQNLDRQIFLLLILFIVSVPIFIYIEKRIRQKTG